MRKLLKLVFLFALAVSPMFGARISNEEIERLMNLMNRTEIVQMVEKDDPPR